MGCISKADGKEWEPTQAYKKVADDTPEENDGI